MNSPFTWGAVVIIRSDHSGIWLRPQTYGRGKSPDWDLMFYIIAARERGSAGLLLKVWVHEIHPIACGNTGGGLWFAKIAFVSVFVEGMGCRGNCRFLL